MFGVTASNARGLQALSLLKGLARMASAGMGWWTAELRGLLPGALFGLLFGPSGDAVLRLTQDGLHLGTPAPHGTWLTEDRASPLDPQVRAVLAKATACTVIMPGQLVLRRAINLPIEAAHDLESAVPFLVERHTSFPLDEVRYDFRLLARDRVRKRAVIELAVVPRTALERPLAIAAAHRLPVAAVRVEGDDGEQPFNLLSRGERDSGASAPRRQLWRPVLATAAAVLVLGLPIVAATVHARAVSAAAEAEAASAAGRRGAALQQEVQAHVRAAAFMPARLRGPQPLELLNELSRSLPDDTWLFSLEAEPGEVKLAGYSHDVPALLRQLAALPFVEAPELRGPIVHGANGRDRFEAGFRVRTPAP